MQMAQQARLAASCTISRHKKAPRRASQYTGIKTATEATPGENESDTAGRSKHIACLERAARGGNCVQLPRQGEEVYIPPVEEQRVGAGVREAHTSQGFPLKLLSTPCDAMSTPIPFPRGNLKQDGRSSMAIAVATAWQSSASLEGAITTMLGRQPM